MRSIIQKNSHIQGLFIEVGWGNGYVVLDKGHPFSGMDYNNIPVDVHGGLTYGKTITEKTVSYYDQLTNKDIGLFMIGFDTCHYGDNPTKWTRSKVKEEADNLLMQCESYNR